MLLRSAELPVPAARAAPTCRHCGVPVTDSRFVESGFCCSGCAYVYRLIHEHGLDAYYRIKDTVTSPADASVFEVRDYAWLAREQAAAEAKAGDGVPVLILDIQGLSCAGCVWLVERCFQQQEGARDVVVNAQMGTARIRWAKGRFDAPGWARTIQSFGYLLGPAGDSSPVLESRSLVKRVGLCAALTLNVMLFALPTYLGMRPDFAYAGLFKLLSLGLATLSVLAGGTYFIARAVAALRAGVMHIDLPIALGIVGAYAATLVGWILKIDRLFYADFVATFIFLMLVGRWAQVAAVERNRRRLLRQQPVETRVRRVEGGDVARERIEPGLAMLLGAGQTVPVESRLEGAPAEFSLASISGEADSRLFNPGQHVPAGAVKLDHVESRLVAVQPWSQSLLAKLLAPQERKDHRHQVLERVVRGYILVILLGSVAAGLGWFAATRDAVKAGSVAIAVLVVSCPCAIGLSLPLVDEVATSKLRRRGLFIRENDLWAKVGRIRAIVFDKTGTLTLESPELLNPGALAGLDAEARSALAALVQDNLHPVGRCLHEALMASGPAVPLAGNVEEHVGCGVALGAWTLGRPGWRSPAMGEGDTVLARDGVVRAAFQFSDAVRPGAAEDVRALRSQGYRVHILSGDHPAKVQAMAAKLGLPPEGAQGGQSPEAKAEWIERNASGDALMLGDGANDSLAFDRALCRGTPVIHRGVLEPKADFYYLRRGIGGIRDLIAMGRTHRRAQAAVITFSVAYNIVACAAAAAGKASPLVAAILMPASSLVSLAIVGVVMRPASDEI